MTQEQILKIISQTEEFYKKNAEEFSKTRQNPWQGWKKLLEIIKNNFSKEALLSVLDLGCGNARFCQFLSDNLDGKIDYTGFDNNDFLMIEAILKHPDQRFKKVNVLTELDKIDQRYDLVVAFGLTHHIPGKEFRKKWFESVLNLVSSQGLAIFTFWNLQSDSRFEKALSAKDLEENDYYYSWGDSQEKRYVHIYDEKEINELSELFKTLGFKLLKTYDSDGKNKRMNTYLILKSTL
jgi:SAM-dependent methyltransferase